MSTPVVDGVSSDVVDARPDVQAALARLRAADAERAAAIAASRPQFRISALFGAPGASLGALLDGRSLAWALASSVSHQVLDGAANRARVHAAGADADAADIAYRKTVLSAWSEVRAALVDQARAGREQAMAAQALAQAATASDLGRLRHAEGTADGLALTALRNDQALAQARSRAANLRTVDARVRLALATGGR
jgi:outer membrane protein TolC